MIVAIALLISSASLNNLRSFCCLGFAGGSLAASIAALLIWSQRIHLISVINKLLLRELRCPTSVKNIICFVGSVSSFARVLATFVIVLVIILLVFSLDQLIHMQYKSIGHAIKCANYDLVITKDNKGWQF